MADYKPIKSFILSWEGGYSNHPNDKGGPTMKGVIWSEWKNYAKRKGFTPTIENLKAITDDQWDDIFRKNYWNPFRGGDIADQSIATLLVDWGYNSGVVTVIKNTQRYLGVKADGIVGPVTLRALNSADAEKTFEAIKARRKKFLEDIVARNASQKVFLKGWLNRLNHINYGSVKNNK